MATNYPDFQSVLRGQMHESATVSTQAPPPEKSGFQGVIVSLALAIGAVIVLRVIIRKFAELKASRKPHRGASGSEAQPATAARPNDKVQPVSPEDASGTNNAINNESENVQMELQDSIGKINAPAQAKWSATEKFIEIAPERIEEIRKLFSEVSRTLSETGRKRTLEELCGRVRALRLLTDVPELQAIDKLVLNLEELFKQSAGKSSVLTPSVMRTAAGAIVLLENLCKPGHHFEWVFDPPPRFLTVDDDPICRRAVASSLKKAFNEPDVAEQGQIALTLAAGRPYDVVFLDVEMPGMDGFEVCTKIHQTQTNASTPVVFVTSHSDFDSRAKSAEAGGHDLIGKPFVPLEITVKALTLLIKRRLQSGGAKQQPAAKSKPVVKPVQPVAERAATPSTTSRNANNKIAESPAATAPAAVPNAKPEIAPAPAPVQPSPKAPEKQPAPQPPAPVATTASNANGEDLVLALMAHIPKELSRLRSQLAAAGEAADAAAMAEILGEFYVGIHSLTGEAERADLRAVFHLSWGVEKLIRKLLEKPNDSRVSILHSARAALDVIEELCRRQAKWDPRNPAIRILVVDDDPISLRVMSNALQLGFGRPDSAQSGEAAIATTSQKEYDVIFLDVLMPGMDGFATCPKIRETNLNSTTPVIFVTSLADASAREQSERAGGNGFILKPVIPVEIALTALTWALRARLDKAHDKPALAEAVH